MYQRAREALMGILILLEIPELSSSSQVRQQTRLLTTIANRVNYKT